MAPPCEDCERTTALEKQIEELRRMIGKPSDKINGIKGEGLVGRLEDLIDKVEIVISEQTRKRETPGRIVRSVLLVLPIIGAATAALNWLYSHLRIVP